MGFIVIYRASEKCNILNFGIIDASFSNQITLISFRPSYLIFPLSSIIFQNLTFSNGFLSFCLGMVMGERVGLGARIPFPALAPATEGGEGVVAHLLLTVFLEYSTKYTQCYCLRFTLKI